MPKKPLHPTLYPSMTRTDSISAFASLVAKAAIKTSTVVQFESLVEPDLNQVSVGKQTSVCHTKIEMRSKPVQLEMDL